MDIKLLISNEARKSCVFQLLIQYKLISLITKNAPLGHNHHFSLNGRQLLFLLLSLLPTKRGKLTDCQRDKNLVTTISELSKIVLFSFFCFTSFFWVYKSALINNRLKIKNFLTTCLRGGKPKREPKLRQKCTRSLTLVMRHFRELSLSTVYWSLCLVVDSSSCGRRIVCPLLNVQLKVC